MYSFNKKNNRSKKGQKIVLSDMTPPIKAIHTNDGIICSVCQGVAQPPQNFPMQKGIRGSTCKACLNIKAAEKRKEKKKDFLYY